MPSDVALTAGHGCRLVLARSLSVLVADLVEMIDMPVAFAAAVSLAEPEARDRRRVSRRRSAMPGPPALLSDSVGEANDMRCTGVPPTCSTRVGLKSMLPLRLSRCWLLGVPGVCVLFGPPSRNKWEAEL